MSAGKRGAPPPVEPEKVQPLHQPFTWLPADLKDDPAAQFAASAMDVFRGIETCLQLIASSNLARMTNAWNQDEQEAPILGETDTERLMRLAIVAAEEWGNKAENQIYRLGEKARPAAPAASGHLGVEA